MQHFPKSLKRQAGIDFRAPTAEELDALAAFTAPFFHDNSAATLREAVEFYNSEAFNHSPAAQEVGEIVLTSDQIDDLVAFLEALTCPHTGDVNEDGQVTPADALLVFKPFLGLVQPPLENCLQDQGDMAAPLGVLTPADALCILRTFLGMPPCAVDQEPAEVVGESPGLTGQ